MWELADFQKTDMVMNIKCYPGCDDGIPWAVGRSNKFGYVLNNI